mmetsp:Transcript_17394/g.40623  ORF Transcript_17394/g.40623 Transcript_17394/m.40623 type:complete len:670 (-) Transcript_17394:76-2085(-)
MEKVKAIFKQFDANGDGQLDSGELAGVLVKLGMKAEDVDELIVAMDTNGDGSIDVEELCRYLCGDKPPPKKEEESDDDDDEQEQQEQLESDSDNEEDPEPPDEVADSDDDDAAPVDDEGLGHKFRAASSMFLSNGWLREVKAAGLTRRAKVYEIEPCVIRAKGQDVVCPRDGRKGAAYVDCLRGPQNAGIATFMLSYTWGYEVGDIADSIKGFCELKGMDRKSSYFWLCCLCINQHRVKEASAKGETVPFSEFQAAFADRVTGIGRILAMMQPWDEPRYVQRVWCDFEMYTATSGQGAKAEVHVTMPPRESQKMIKSLTHGYRVNTVFSNLAKLQVEEAQASVAEDRQRILDLIKSGPGYHKLNSVVAKHLQNWVIEEALQKANEGKKAPGHFMNAVKLCRGVGELCRRVGLWEQAAPLLRDGIEILRKHDALNCKIGADLLRALGNLYRQRRQMEKSIATLQECVEVSKAANTLQTRQGGYLMRAIGKFKMQEKDYDAALQAFEEAKGIFEGAGSMHTTDASDLHRDIGTVARMTGDKKKAEHNYEIAIDIRRKQGAMMSTDACELLRQMGLLCHQRKNYDEALKLFYEAKESREKMAMMETVGGGGLWNNIGNSRRDKKEYESAIEAYKLSKAMYIKAGREKRPAVAQVERNMNRAQKLLDKQNKKK